MTLPNAILTLSQVSSIKEALFEGDLIAKLARKYRVNYRTISHIKCGRTWDEVEWPDGTKGGIPVKRRVELVRLRMTQRNGSTAKRSKRK